MAEVVIKRNENRSGNSALKKVIKYSDREKKFMIENGIDIKNVITITVDYALDEYVVNEDIEKIWQRRTYL